ncbi:MAG: hypothetical protein M1820_004241 [Bogoriella megaspora]|nr:MAG: hypothetical protein M1820_004241 [Bogoriella megaspora]
MASDILTDSQNRALVITERVNSSISIASILLILVTFWFSPYFNKPINRLFFFASWGNLGSCIAALISEDGPNAGGSSALCQVQAFLVQMFLGVDALWAFCMAINVYLSMFRGYSIKQLRKLDAKYLLFCYGVSFVPAFIFIFISTSARGHVYGPAVIWCWISLEWDFMRVAFLYGWIWLAIVFAFIIYFKAGLVIWEKRKHLSGFMNPLNDNPFTGVITTTIHVSSHELQPTDSNRTEHIPSAHGVPEAIRAPSTSPDSIDPYTVTIDSEPQKPHHPAILRMRTLTREAANDEINAEAWLYARVAILFFIALLITWVPSSVNRVFALARPNQFNFALNYASSFVFPLQGFWNVIVYILTSRTACQKLWDDLWMRRPRAPASIHRVVGRGSVEDPDNRLTRFRLGSDASIRGLFKGAGTPV